MRQIIKGISSPSIDFARVEDNSRATLRTDTLDLSSARVKGQAVALNITGNVFYIDPGLPGSEYEGAVATLMVRDAEVTIGPGFYMTEPFADLRIYNTAQPGKKLRIVYGVDIGLNPWDSRGGNSQIALDYKGLGYEQEYLTYSSGAFGTQYFVTAGSNTKGVVVLSAWINWSQLVGPSATPSNVGLCNPGILLIIDGDLSQPNYGDSQSFEGQIFGSSGAWYSLASGVVSIRESIYVPPGKSFGGFVSALGVEAYGSCIFKRQ